MTEKVEIPDGLRRAYMLVLAPAAFLAPIPLFFTGGAGAAALAAYEAAVLLLWWRARAGRPVRLSNAVLNAVGLSYVVWLSVELTVVKPGLLRTVVHLLLFTATAKLASLKYPAEARTALLVLFLLALSAASSSFHVSSLLYFGAMAWIAFRTLSRLAVLADFDTAPPDRVVDSIPTGGLAAAAMAGALLIGGPLFYALPRLRAPYAVAPFRLEEALATTLTADRVDLEAFSSAKKSDRVVLRFELDPERELPRVLRLREAVFTEYRDGSWLHGSLSAAGQMPPSPGVPRSAPAGQGLAARISVEMNLVARGFIFLPYGSYDLSFDSGIPSPQPDGVVAVSGGQRAVRYSASVARVEPKGPGRSIIDPRSVPREIRAYAAKLTGDLTDPQAIWDRIRRHFLTDFVYTLEPPRAPGDPVVHFLLRSKAGHCEYFASAAALMLTARGIPARLVTGSYGAESGFFSSALVVRGGNLHAWVEANLEGSGFAVLDPTPPSGIPSNLSRRSLWERLAGVGREVEFFYDRRILGFDSLDQAQAFDAARQKLGGAAESLLEWKDALKGFFVSRPAAAALVTLAAVVFAAFARRFWRRRRPVDPATRAYLVLRRLAARSAGAVPASVAPAEVARLFASARPQGRGDAFAIVDVYCASAFGGRAADAETERELVVRLRRLRNIA